MTMMFGKCNLSWNGAALTSDCVVESAEWDLSATECAPMHLSLSSAPAEFNTTAYINTGLLHQITSQSFYAKPEGVFHYNKHIMIQARWHKKARIRKKWLHRYGMKPDTVKVQYVCETVTWDMQSHTWDMYIDTNKVKYLWRPDQKRRERKIEWV